MKSWLEKRKKSVILFENKFFINNLCALCLLILYVYIAPIIIKIYAHCTEKFLRFIVLILKNICAVKSVPRPYYKKICALHREILCASSRLYYTQSQHIPYSQCESENKYDYFQEAYEELVFWLAVFVHDIEDRPYNDYLQGKHHPWAGYAY